MLLIPTTIGILESSQMVSREEETNFAPRRMGRSKGEMRCYKGKEKNVCGVYSLPY